jgi:hypothetical protein
MSAEDEPITLEEAQRLLADYDAIGWEQPPGFETDRHNLLHVCITVGKMAAAMEAVEDHRTAPTPLPRSLVLDMIIYGLRFANNEEGFTLTPELLKRIEELRKRNDARKTPLV